MPNATSLRRTFRESQTRRIRQNSCSVTFASAVIAVGLITLSSGDTCGKRSFDSSWSSATETGGCGGGVWKLVRQSKRADVDQPPPRDTLQQDGWSVRVEHTLAGFHRAKEGVFLASQSTSTKRARKSLCWYRTGMVVRRADSASCVSWRTFSCSTRAEHQKGGSVKDGGTKQIVLSLSKQYTDKQGWEAAELAPRVAARRWLQHTAGVQEFGVRPPTRIVGRRLAALLSIAHCVQVERTA